MLRSGHCIGFSVGVVNRAHNNCQIFECFEAIYQFSSSTVKFSRVGATCSASRRRRFVCCAFTAAAAASRTASNGLFGAGKIHVRLLISLLACPRGLEKGFSTVVRVLGGVGYFVVLVDLFNLFCDIVVTFPQAEEHLYGLRQTRKIHTHETRLCCVVLFIF